MSHGGVAITVKGLEKSFKNQKVLQGIEFEIQKGSIFALLGANGAGKTTTVKILSTLMRPDAGVAIVDGIDVRKKAGEVRKRISLTGQYASVDELLTGRENLDMIGRLNGLDKQRIAERSATLLREFELEAAADKRTATYSGGMRRKLDLAISLLSQPSIIFLDEPTTGLDPRSRGRMWEIIKKLAHEGTTIFLTTQYLDEADALADRITLLNNGKIIAEGTAAQLKEGIGDERVELTFASKEHAKKAKQALHGYDFTAHSDPSALSVATDGTPSRIKDILIRLDKAGIEAHTINLRTPTLDDVFMKLTQSKGEEV